MWLNCASTHVASVPRSCLLLCHRRYSFFHTSTALVGLGLLIVEVSPSHSDTPDSVGLLWASDRHVAKTSTWKLTTLARVSCVFRQRLWFEPAIPSNETYFYTARPPITVNTTTTTTTTTNNNNNNNNNNNTVISWRMYHVYCPTILVYFVSLRD